VTQQRARLGKGSVILAFASCVRGALTFPV
jgi:hypothetical protein